MSSLAVSSSSSLHPSLSISTSELIYIRRCIHSNIRLDGRNCLDYRYFALSTSTIPTSYGSSRIVLGGSEIIVSISAEIIAKNEEEQEEGERAGEGGSNSNSSSPFTLVIDMSPVATLLFNTQIPSASSTYLTHLTSTLTLLLLSSHTFPSSSSLSISSHSSASFPPHYWHFTIDVLILNASGGNLIDAIGMGIKAALLTTKVPKVEVVIGEGGEPEIVIGEKEEESEKLKGVETIPMLVTLYRFAPTTTSASFGSGLIDSSNSSSKVSSSNYMNVLDCSIEEELASSNRVICAIDRNGCVCGIRKEGKGGISVNGLKETITIAKQIGKEMNRKIEEVVQKKENQKGFGTE